MVTEAVQRRNAPSELCTICGTMWFAVEMLLLGCAVGMISTALGLGGGIVMVPAFVYFVEGMDAHTAKGTSLFIIVFVSAMNAVRMNRGQEDRRLGLVAAISAGSIIGGYAGSWTTTKISDAGVIWVFIALLGFVGVRTFFIKPRIVRREDVRVRNAPAFLFGALAGLVGGATGTGGGAVLVPLALMAGLVTNERAVALSNTVMVLTSISGTVAHLLAPRTVDLPWTVGHVNFALAPLVFIGAQLITPVAHPFEKWLTLPRRKVVMGILLLVMTAGLVWKTLHWETTPRGPESAPPAASASSAGKPDRSLPDSHAVGDDGILQHDHDSVADGVP